MPPLMFVSLLILTCHVLKYYGAAVDMPYWFWTGMGFTGDRQMRRDFPLKPVL